MIMDEPAQVKPKKINVPTQYREGAKILKQMVEEGKSLKNLVYNNQHLRISSMSKLMGLIQAHEQQLEEVIKKTEIFEKEKYLNPWLGRILISELLFGRKQLIGQSKPVQCVLSYQEELEKALASVEAKPKEQKLLKYNGETLQDQAPALIPRDDSLMTKQSAFALLWLFLYSCAMFTFPFAAFFGTRHVLQTKYELDPFTVTCSSVIAAVLTVNFIIVLYAMQGYRDIENENYSNESNETAKEPDSTKKTK
uniref:CSON001424 protein n=2 Tax=Culicoides sonorensis TaxID=179676 RepID=A0A336MKL6_CULSO